MWKNCQKVENLDPPRFSVPCTENWVDLILLITLIFLRYLDAGPSSLHRKTAFLCSPPFPTAYFSRKGLCCSPSLFLSRRRCFGAFSSVRVSPRLRWGGFYLSPSVSVPTFSLIHEAGASGNSWAVSFIASSSFRSQKKKKLEISPGYDFILSPLELFFSLSLSGFEFRSSRKFGPCSSLLARTFRVGSEWLAIFFTLHYFF